MSGHSRNTLERIKDFWLNRKPPALSNEDYNNAKYLLFDGTYFHKDGCLAIVMNYQTKRLVAYKYIERESYYNVYPLFADLKDKGVMPRAITLDGHRMVISAILDIWPEVLIQRCLYHIQRQGLQWLRVCPRTQAGQHLRKLFYMVTDISTDKDVKDFVSTYKRWHKTYRQQIKSLPRESPANIDLKKAMALINHALPDMFHYIKERNIAPTTNMLESFYSRLKHDYRGHRGMSEQHKISYLNWYCYFANRE